MRQVLRLVQSSLILILISASLVQADSPPNIVLIISDDQSWTDYGFMGHDVIQTPNLDRLARQSALFTRGYVPTSLCRPSLATILSGLYAHQHKISGNDPALFPGKNGGRGNPEYQKLLDQLIGHIDEVSTLPKLLRGHGYVSHQSGKWWEGNFRRGGFTAGMTHGDPKRGGRHGDEGLKIGRQGMQPLLDFIDSAGDKPFFVWYAPFLPHTPHNPPQRLLKKYTSPDRPIQLARYYAMCEWFDETCGQLVDHLEENDLRENTLVVYVTDNGWIQRVPTTKVPAGWRPQFAPKSKQSPNEGGTRTPIMLHWPGKIKPIKDEKTLVSSIDLAPTILSACGIDPPPGMSGVNLLDYCCGNPVKRDTIFGEGFAHDIANVNDPEQSLLSRWCIHDRWKLILSYNGKIGRYKPIHADRPKRPQLFDVMADPHEEKNVAAEHPEIVQQLSAKLDQWWTPKRLKPFGIDN